MARLLVVDDRAPNRDFVRSLLAYYGHEVAEAADGVEALDALQRKGFDLVFTDIVMPFMDGVELVRRMRQDRALVAVPVVFYTATYRAREARAIAGELGVKWVLPKPCEPREIVAVVQEALGQPMPAESPLDPAQREEALEITHSQGLRLAMMEELALELGTQRDPAKLLELFCRATQGMLGTAHAGVAIVDAQHGVRQFASRGLPPGSEPAIAAALDGSPLVARMRMEERPVRAGTGAAPLPPDMVPCPHPPVASILFAPVGLPDHRFGWLYAAGRVNSGPFPVEDERMAQTIAGQLAGAWASLALHEELREQATRLRQEIAERRRAEEEVQRLNAELESRVARRTADLAQAMHEMESFSHSLSHDLRAPLRSLDGFSFVLLQDYRDKLDDEGRDALARIRAASQRMGRIIDDLQRLASASRCEPHRESLDLTAIAREIAGTLQEQHPARKVRWVIEEGMTPVADPAWMRVAMRQLLENAWKFTGGVDGATIHAGTQRNDGGVVYFVADNGVGFDMAHADKLFGAFQRLHRPDEFPGSGTGLAIVKRIVERHGGRLWAQAKPGAGATFLFTVGKPASAP